MKIAVAGTGYVGLSMAVLLSQHNEVTAVDIVSAKVDLINGKRSPIADKEIEEYLAKKELHLTATTDGASAYKDAEFVIISTPTNYDERKNYFRQTLETLQELEDMKVFKSHIHVDSSIEWSQDHSKPVLVYKKTSRSAKEYMELAKEVETLCQ